MTALVEDKYIWKLNVADVVQNKPDTTQFTIDECTFYLKLLACANEQSEPINFLSLHLFALPKIYGAIKIESFAECEQIQYKANVSPTMLTAAQELTNEKNTHGHSVVFNEPILLDTLKTNQHASLSATNSPDTLELKCVIKILNYYDFEEYEVNPYGKQLLVDGYINSIDTFIPKSISKMIYNYYLTIMSVTDLTAMAIEIVFSGETHINRREIGEIYKRYEIDTAKLSCMTEMGFSHLLMRCPYGRLFSRHQRIKIHREIKSLLNISIEFRYDIDIGKAIIYLINEDNLFITRDINIKPEKIIAAFKNHNVKELLKMDKKIFIKILAVQSNNVIKLGHATKLWNSIKAFIQDCNVEIPNQILIKKEEDKE